MVTTVTAAKTSLNKLVRAIKNFFFYSNLFNWSYFSEIFWSGTAKDCIWVHTKKSKIVALCSHFPQNVKLGSSRCSRAKTAKKCTKERVARESCRCCRSICRFRRHCLSSLRLWLLDHEFLIQTEQMRTVCVVTKHSWLGNRLLYCGSNTRHSFQSSTFCFPHLDKHLLPLESEK